VSGDYAELSQQTQDMLLAYDMLPRYSGSLFLLLGMSTGILVRALGLDVDCIGAAPVMISSTFDFEFRPHAAVEQLTIPHKDEAEVCASFVSRQQGERVVVALEAERGRPRAVAYHELFYPLLGMGTTAGSKFASVIPVDLRATTADITLQYHMYECEPIAIQHKVETLKKY
jgi:hypothetical protein